MHRPDFARTVARAWRVFWVCEKLELFVFSMVLIRESAESAQGAERSA
jgi:hypothetical protein